FGEQGRQMLAAGDSGRALAFLGEALRRGAGDAPTRFLAGQALADLEPLEAVLAGHTQAVQTVDLSPDAARLVSAGMEGIVTLWDLATRTRRVAVPGGYQARFTPDGKTVVSLQIAGPISTWDASNLAPRAAVFLPGKDRPWAMAIGRDLVAAV